MRTLRLTLLALGLCLLALPTAVLAQAPDSSSIQTTPLARLPADQAPLAGTPWRLRDYRFHDVERTVGPEVAASVRFNAGELAASGGCTTFRGRYGAMGSAIEIALRGLKENDCAEQTMMVQLSMVDGLRRAASFEIVSGPAALDDELVLRDVNGVELLRFEVDDLSALEVGEWQLESYSVADEETLADADQPAVLHFRAKRSNDARRQSTGKATGSSGCNGFKADYYRYADAISFGPIDRTEAPCTPAVTAQEEAMLSVLDATSSWLALEPDRLRVSSAETGNSLTFMSSRPLEGSTWLVARVPGVTGLGGEVTLRLEDGTATGQGPCGPYSAAYVSDGLFITFRELVGPADQACAAVAAERAWFAALRQTVRLDRDQPQLRFLDARGDVTARLKAPSGP